MAVGLHEHPMGNKSFTQLRKKIWPTSALEGQEDKRLFFSSSYKNALKDPSLPMHSTETTLYFKN